jgi:hypothetical protein
MTLVLYSTNSPRWRTLGQCVIQLIVLWWCGRWRRVAHCSSGLQECSLVLRHSNAQLLVRFNQGQESVLVRSRIGTANVSLDASTCG